MATDIKYIKHLLEKFYEGTTSPEEDNILYEFFSSTSEIPEEMEADSKIFTALSDSSKYAVPPSDLPDRIMKAVDNTIISGHKSGVPPQRKRFSVIAIASFAMAAAITAFIMLAPFTTGITPDTTQLPTQLASLETGDSIDKNPAISDSIEHTADNHDAKNSEQSVKVCHPDAKGVTSPPVSTLAKAATKTESIPELTEEELIALEAGMKALAHAGEQMAYASNCLESTDDNLRNIYSSIQSKLKLN